MISSSQLSAPQQKRFGKDRNVRLTLSSYHLSIPPSQEAAQASNQAIGIGGLPVRQGSDMGGRGGCSIWYGSRVELEGLLLLKIFTRIIFSLQ